MTETESLYYRAGAAETARRDGQHNPPASEAWLNNELAAAHNYADILRHQRDTAESIILRMAQHIESIGGNGMETLERIYAEIKEERTAPAPTPEQLQPTNAQRRMMEEARERQQRQEKEHPDPHAQAVAEIQTGVKQ